MSIFKQAAIALRDLCWAGLHGARCLRELCLVVGGIGIATVGMSWAIRIEAEGLAASIGTGVPQTEAARPIYHVDLQEDSKTAWIRRGGFSLTRIRLEDAAILEWIPVFGSCVMATSHSQDGRVHALSTMPGGVTIVRDGKMLVDNPTRTSDATELWIAVSPDGARVAAINSNCELLLWELTDEQPVERCRTLGFHPVAVAWSPDSQRLLVGGECGHLALLASDGAAAWSRQLELPRISALAWSPDGSRIAAGSIGGQLLALWADDGFLQWKRWQDKVQICAVAFAPDGRQLAVGGFDRVIDVLSARDGSLRVSLTGHDDTIRTLQFLSDGDRLLSGSYDGTLRIWSVRAGRQIQQL